MWSNFGVHGLGVGSLRSKPSWAHFTLNKYYLGPHIGNSFPTASTSSAAPDAFSEISEKTLIELKDDCCFLNDALNQVRRCNDDITAEQDQIVKSRARIEELKRGEKGACGTGHEAEKMD